MPDTPELRYANTVSAGGTGDLYLGAHIPGYGDLKNHVQAGPRTLELTVDSGAAVEYMTATVGLVGENLVASARNPSRH